ncbi:hypothetical protein RND81_02G014100 [Saponaria officinalis]|uniref:MLO-like protein n=1 Tax=Saponaria officinalis TaxID=3572 RepID=A0AAW1MSM3_SAPOF
MHLRSVFSSGYGVFIQVLCSHSTLPLYAIVTQMGSNFKKAIFEEHVQAGILVWRDKVRKKKGLSGKGSLIRPGSTGSLIRPSSTASEGSSQRSPLARVTQKDGDEIQPSKD